jgi:hypothetical protein
MRYSVVHVVLLQAVDIHGAGWVWSAILSCSTMGVALNYALFLCKEGAGKGMGLAL